LPQCDTDCQAIFYINGMLQNVGQIETSLAVLFRGTFSWKSEGLKIYLMC